MASTPLWNIRIPDDLREAVLEKARLEGRTGSEVVREFLVEWVQSPPRRPERPKLKTWKTKR